MPPNFFKLGIDLTGRSMIWSLDCSPTKSSLGWAFMPNHKFHPSLVTLWWVKKVLIMIIRLDNLLWENIVTLSHYPFPSNKMGFDGPLILRSLNNASASTASIYCIKNTSLGSVTQTRNLKSHRLMEKEILIMADTNKRRLKPELKSLQVYGDDTLVG